MSAKTKEEDLCCTLSYTSNLWFDAITLALLQETEKGTEDYGVEMSSYDMCMANRETSRGHQLSMLWHVDDLKISCKDKFKVMKLIGICIGYTERRWQYIKAEKGKYLRMMLVFTESGMFQVDISEYVNKIPDDFQEEVSKESVTPHPDDLSNMEDENTATYFFKE